MNRQTHERFVLSRRRENSHARVDHISAAHVDRALELQAVDGTSCAIEYLKVREIDPEVIVRVLTLPSARRKKDLSEN